MKVLNKIAFVWMLHLLFPVFLIAQENNEVCILINNETPRECNFELPKKNRTHQNTNDFTEIKDYLGSSKILKGYNYKLNLNDFSGLVKVPDLEYLDNILPDTNFSFVNTNLFKQNSSNLNFNSSLNVNGLTNLITLEGKLNKYKGDYFLQVSYHVSSNNTNYIPKIVNEKHQRGLALILKVNLERGK